VHEVSPDASDPGRFKFIEVNDRACQYLGYSREELLQMSVPQIDAPETLSNVPAIVKKLFTEGRATWEGIHVSKDERKIHVEISNQLFELYGKPMILSTVRDITERKKAEEALRESESKFHSLFDMSPLVIAVTDVETGKLIDVNEKFCEVAKYDRKEICGHTTTELGFYSRDDRERFLKELLSYGEVRGLEMDFKVRDGSIVNSLMFSRLVQINGKTFILTVFQDITERKRFEESLKQLMHKHQLILDAAGEGIVGMDLEGKITFANPFVIGTTGYKIEELIGQKLHNLLHYKKPDGTPYPYEECPSYETLKNGTPKNIRDEVFFKKDGTSFPVRYTSTPIIEEGIIKGAVVTFRDITERKRLEEQFLQAQKMEAVGHLAGGVAHDFNNILTAIIGYGNLLQMKIKEDDPLRAYINQILLSSEKAANLTHGLLAFSRKQIINPKPVNLNDIVKNVEKLLLRLIGEDIELKTILNPLTPPFDKGGQGGIGDLIVMADSGQIEQVLMNLATNARDAMPEGGTLTISTEIVELDREYIITSGYGKPGKYALISVADTGKGIDEKTKRFIFEPFFTTKERGKGTGLGLAVAYGIIKQHNGNIEVYSELGKGTTFRIYLPIVEAEVEETEPKVITTPIGGKETILIAEDNIDVRNYTKTVLEEFGYKVIEAVNGEDAINRFMENKNIIEFLLLDVIMPKKNGKEVYDAIKKVWPDIKALFMSGYAEDIIHRKGILEEGLNFVLKPISPQELLKRIREILESKK
jgi:PAS domain S-box-containing protein